VNPAFALSLLTRDYIRVDRSSGSEKEYANDYIITWNGEQDAGCR
jgi:hypothetical protein